MGVDRSILVAISASPQLYPQRKHGPWSPTKGRDLLNGILGPTDDRGREIPARSYFVIRTQPEMLG